MKISIIMVVVYTIISLVYLLYSGKESTLTGLLNGFTIGAFLTMAVYGD